MTAHTVHLGFEVGTGSPVAVPLAHTFVTGQTQAAGKTTTLQAIVARAGRRALAFVTKRGETFPGRRIPPYLPREGERPIHWRLVETILASALGQRSLKYERLWIVNAAKGARSLADVRRNVERLKAKAKGNTADVYLLLGEYLDLVLPEMEALGASDALDLRPGANVMDLAGVGPQLQALVIRAALERVNQHEREVLTVFPEAWEFAPRGRTAPAKDEAVAMARKGAVLGNFLLCDSQDLAGVETTVRQAASVWILGVQRELNELKRTIDSIPAGVKKPKAADVATLGLGQFYACWGRHAVKVYVQPAWMNDAQARQVAEGALTPELAARLSPRPSPPEPETPQPQPPAMPDTPSPDELKNALAVLQRLAAGGQAAQAAADQAGGRPAPDVRSRDDAPAGGKWSPADEDLYQRFKARLCSEAPVMLQVLAERPDIQVKVERPVIEAAGDSLRGRVALLIRDGFFDAGVTGHAVNQELARRGQMAPVGSLYGELDGLARMGFLLIEPAKDKKAGKRYVAVPEAKGRVRS